MKAGEAVSNSFVSLNFLRFGSWGHKLGIGMVTWYTNPSLHTSLALDNRTPVPMALFSMLLAKGKLLTSHQNAFGCHFLIFSPSTSLPWWKKMLFSWQLGRPRVEENSFKEQMFKTNSSFCYLMECSVSGCRTRVNPVTVKNKQKKPQTLHSPHFKS